LQRTRDYVRCHVTYVFMPIEERMKLGERHNVLRRCGSCTWAGAGWRIYNGDGLVKVHDEPARRAEGKGGDTGVMWASTVVLVGHPEVGHAERKARIPGEKFPPFHR